MTYITRANWVKAFFYLSVISLALTACSTSDVNDEAARAVERYWQALAENDEIGMVNTSCASWETQARQEFTSFAAVEVNLVDVECSTIEEISESVVVTCSGQIIANYGAEDLVIELNERSYQVIKEAGEWRFCGYK